MCTSQCIKDLKFCLMAKYVQLLAKFILSIATSGHLLTRETKQDHDGSSHAPRNYAQACTTLLQPFCKAHWSCYLREECNTFYMTVSACSNAPQPRNNASGGPLWTGIKQRERKKKSTSGAKRSSSSKMTLISGKSSADRRQQGRQRLSYITTCFRIRAKNLGWHSQSWLQLDIGLLASFF